MILRRFLLCGLVILGIAFGIMWVDATWRGTPIVQQAVEDEAGSNRLELIQAPQGFGLFTVQGYDFETLIWKTNTGATWKKRIEITRKEFTARSPHLRWVSAIHSIDGINGIAIIKVAEGSAPEGSATIWYLYSWREWNLLTNGEARMIRTLNNPFEEFEESSKPSPE